MSRWVAAVLVAVTAIGVGCTPTSHDHSATTRPALANDVDPVRAEPEYWLGQTPALSIGNTDFDRLWNAAARVSQDYLFKLDRQDRRSGLLTTAPNISAQWFEPWRREVQTAGDRIESSAFTQRRTINWQFRKVSNGWAVTPKVLIERQSVTEKRISGVLSRAYFRTDPKDESYGTRETDQNLRLPPTYWYPIGRDFTLEQRLIEKMFAQLG